MNGMVVLGPMLLCAGAVCGVGLLYLAITSLRDARRSGRRGDRSRD
ncbi:hypothetical protein [Collinsella sp. D33t1_170424_A12]|nr:hypothetical protein [Collinsella sp. D33t1_170424_A12]